MENHKNCASTWLNRYEYGKKEIGIFEMAELLGVTSEALRKYENKEIIHPIRDERGYRKFHSWDLTKIICARQMRQEGFALSDIADGMKNEDPQEQINMIEEMQKVLMQEILYRKKLIHWLSEQKNEVMRSEQIGERCVVEHLPALHCCVYMVDDTLVNKKGEARDHLKQWLKALPFINVYYVGVVDDKTLSCLVLTEDEMHTYELEHLTADFVIPEQYYAVTYAAAEHDSEHDTSEACILSSLQRAQGMNMKLGNYMVGRMVRYIQHAGKYVSVNKMCYPIADE